METIKQMAGKFHIFQKIEDASGKRLRKEHALIITLVLLAIAILTTPIGALITTIVGCIVPLKETLFMLRSPNPNLKEMRHFVIFWLVFSIVTVFDAYSSYLLPMIPFFFVFKLALLLWLGPLKFGATDIIHDNILSRIPNSFLCSSPADISIRDAGKFSSKVVKSVADAVSKEKDE